MRNDYDDDSAGYADSLTDLDFFAVALAALGGFVGLMFWLVPPLARYFSGWV